MSCHVWSLSSVPALPQPADRELQGQWCFSRPLLRGDLKSLDEIAMFILCDTILISRCDFPSCPNKVIYILFNSFIGYFFDPGFNQRLHVVFNCCVSSSRIILPLLVFRDTDVFTL